MNNLTNHPLLKTQNVMKVLDEVPIDPKVFRGATMIPMRVEPEDFIRYDVRHATGGLTKPVAPGAESPIIEFGGGRQVEFAPAHFREKVILGENDIRNIRKWGSSSESRTAEDIMAEKIVTLRMRTESRIEWARWKCIFGALTVNEAGISYTIDYKLPNFLNPTAAIPWSTLASAVPVDDIALWMGRFENIASRPIKIWMNQNTYRNLIRNADIKTRFNQLLAGGLNNTMNDANSLTQVLQTFVPGNLELEVYDASYEIVSYVTTPPTHGGTTIALNTSTGMENGDVITLYDDQNDISQSTIVAAVTGLTVTVDNVAKAYSIGTRAQVKKRFIPNNKVIIQGVLPPGTVGGTNFAEFLSINSVYGRGTLMSPKPGPFVEVQNKELTDPKTIEVIGGVNGLPVKYYSDTNLVANV